MRPLSLRRGLQRAVLCLGLTLAAAAPALAQLAEGGARRLALGRAGVALGGEAWGVANPATWATLADRRLALEGSQAFGLADLRLGAASAAVPTSFGTLAVSGRSFGGSVHRETRVVAGIARPLALSRVRALDVGLAVGVESASTEGFGSASTVLLDAGVQGDLLPALRLGLSARNLLGLGRGAETDLQRSVSTVPTLAVGLAYTPSDHAVLVLDALQDLDRGLSMRAGAEARPVDVLALRVGVSTQPVRYTAGLGVLAGPARVDLAVEQHETLGLTPAFGVEVGF
ncbi:MAG: hypothetical protein AAF170_03700 [Bacteroidota bacterium]